MFRRTLATLAALALIGQAQIGSAAAFETPAKTAILMDYDSGAVLYDKGADLAIPPASMTKLVLADVVFSKLKSGEITMDTKFRVSKKAWEMGGSKMFVQLDTEVRVEDLLRGVIIQSGNDACIVLAEGIAGSEQAMVDMMNARARELGMTNSFFENVSGMPGDKHRMSARDLAIITRHIIATYPEHFHFYSEKEFSWSFIEPNGKEKTIKQGNRNPLLYATPPGDGMKTGHTEEAGYCLTGTEKRGDQRMIMVVTGLESEKQRAEEATRFMEAAFKEFKRYDLFAKGATVADAEVWNGDFDRVAMTVAEPLRVYLTPEARHGLKVSYSYTAPLVAPIAEGQQIGTMKVEAPGQETRTVALVAATTVEEAGIVGRIMNAISLELSGYEPAS